jgi:hypothetical protein
MDCPPAIIYMIIGFISVLVYVYITYKANNTTLYGKAMSLLGFGSVTYVHLICLGILLLCILSSMGALINELCMNNMIIAWVIAILLILCQIIGIYKSVY